MSEINSTEHLRPTLKIGVSGYRSGCRCAGCVQGKRLEMKSYSQRPEVKVKKLTYERSEAFLNRRRKRAADPEWRQRMNEYRREYHKRSGRVELLADIKAKVDAIKVSRGCADCGYNANPIGLDFDHVRGEKTAEVSDMLRWAWARILEEIAKCDVVCAICHRIRTHNRKQSNYRV